MTTAHAFASDEVMAFLDGELPPARARLLQAHVAGCDECQHLADGWQRLSAALSEWRVGEPPETLTPPTGAQGAAATHSSVGRPRFWRRPIEVWVAAAAVVTVVTAAALSVLSHQSRQALQLPTAEAPMPASYSSAIREEQPAISDLALADKNGGSGQLQLETRRIEDKAQASDAPLIVRSVTLGLLVDRLDDGRTAVDRIVRQHGGSISGFTLTGGTGSSRSFSATLRVPVASLDATLLDLRGVGTVTAESQTAEAITDAHRDLTIRIDNAKREAARLNDLLARRTDRLADVLAVEQAQARVQTEIEQMTAQEAAMRDRAALSTIAVDVRERYRAALAGGPVPIGARLRNAFVDGARSAIESVTAMATIVIGLAPSIALWFAILAPPAWIVWRLSRRLRRTP